MIRAEYLIHAYLDGDATEAEVAELAALLKAKPELRNTFAESAFLHGCLTDTFLDQDIMSGSSEATRKHGPSAVGSAPVPNVLNRSTSNTSHSALWRARWWLAVSGIAAALVIGTFLWPHESRHSWARMKDANHAQWNDVGFSPAIGDNIPDTQLELSGGVIQLEITGGTSVVVEGPATFSVPSKDRVELRRGQLTAVVGAQVHGFSVQTPQSLVTDLGTAFGVRVTGQDTTEVATFQGTVKAELRGGSHISETISAGSAAVITHSGITLQPAVAPFIRAIPSLDAVDLTHRHQEIDNFGASDAWTMQKIGAWSDASKNRVADLLFSTEKGIGLSLWRFNIGGGFNPNIHDAWRTVETFEVGQGQYDWSKQANELWFARAARDRGVPYLLGFVNSPPGRMTKNGLTNSGSDDTSSTNLKPGMERQYASYLCDIVEHFKRAPDNDRLIFNYLSPINEPQIAWETSSDQEGNRASNEDIKKILQALHDEIASRNLDVKIRALESNSVRHLYEPAAAETRRWGAPYGDYLRVFCGDPAVVHLMDGVLSYHDYNTLSDPSVRGDHARLGQEMPKYPDLKLWTSDVCMLQSRRDLTINLALEVAALIHTDLVVSGTSAWQWWRAVSNGDFNDGLLYTDWRRPGDPESIIESKAFWVLGNFSRFIRPGFVRVELTGDHHAFDGLLGSAYMDPKTGKLVLVYINAANEPHNVNWTIRRDAFALPERFVPWETSADDNLNAHPAINVADGFEVPPRSVVTLVGE